MTKTITPVIALFSVFVLLNGVAPAQSDSKQSSSRFDITLNDSWVEKLKSLGTLQSAVREDVRGRIAAIQIEFADTENQPYKVVDAPISVSGNACQISISDSLLEQARSQPVRINVPDNSQFAQVFLNYASGSAPAAAAANMEEKSNGSGLKVQNASTPASPIESSVPFHFIKLSENKVMMGQMELTEKLKFTTKFGDVDISLGQIAGIRFHIDGEDSAIVCVEEWRQCNRDSRHGFSRVEYRLGTCGIRPDLHRSDHNQSQRDFPPVE